MNNFKTFSYKLNPSEPTNTQSCDNFQILEWGRRELGYFLLQLYHLQRHLFGQLSTEGSPSRLKKKK